MRDKKTNKKEVMNMNIKKFIIVVIVALMSAIISFGRVAQAGPPGGQILHSLQVKLMTMLLALAKANANFPYWRRISIRTRMG